MFLFENSLTGAYWNRLYDFEERRGFFLCYGRIKANSAAKELNVTNINTYGDSPNRQIGLSLNSSFVFNCQNDYDSGAAINFDYVTPPSISFTLFKKYK